MVVPLKIIHRWIFPEINHPAIGVAQFMETPKWVYHQEMLFKCSLIGKKMIMMIHQYIGYTNIDKHTQKRSQHRPNNVLVPPQGFFSWTWGLYTPKMLYNREYKIISQWI